MDAAFAADPRDVACLLPTGYGVREEVNGVSIDMLTVLEQGENPDCRMISTDDTCRGGRRFAEGEGRLPVSGEVVCQTRPFIFEAHQWQKALGVQRLGVRLPLKRHPARFQSHGRSSSQNLSSPDHTRHLFRSNIATSNEGEHWIRWDQHIHHFSTRRCTGGNAHGMSPLLAPNPLTSPHCRHG